MPAEVVPMDEKEQTDWLEEEMKTLVLGEKRLEKRARKIVRDLSQNPTGSIPEMSDDWAATKAAYRFLKNETVKASKLVEAQKQATIKRIERWASRSQDAMLLIVDDTTSFDYSSWSEIGGLGMLDSKYCCGFLAHSSLAVTPEQVPLGLLAQETWVRDYPADRPRGRQVPIEDKESYKWLQALDDSTADLPADVHVLVVSDRESDVYEYFVRPRRANVDLLIRACQDRRVEEPAKKLWAAVHSSPVRGVVQVEVGRGPNQSLRDASCQVYYQRVKLRPPKNRPASLPKLEPVVLWAVLIRERAPPEEVKPLEWLLLTTCPVTTFEQALQTLQYYACRWIVERFHFVLKSGCGVEKRHLDHVDRLIRFLAIANILAWRLLWQTYLARVEGDLPCTAVLTDCEWKALYSFIHKTAITPESPPSLAQATLWLARLGGFLARASDGSPGVKVLWRGWRRLFDITETWLIFNSSEEP
jgi:hypothetical protein